MTHGLKNGIIFLVLGVILVIVNLFMIQSGSYFPKLLLIGTTFTGLGLGFILFKGGNPGSEVAPKEKSKIHWREAPVVSRIMWILFAIAGLGGGVLWMVSIGGF
jgi:hypothetical protein